MFKLLNVQTTGWAMLHSNFRTIENPMSSGIVTSVRQAEIASSVTVVHALSIKGRVGNTVVNVYLESDGYWRSHIDRFGFVFSV